MIRLMYVLSFFPSPSSPFPFSSLSNTSPPFSSSSQTLANAHAHQIFAMHGIGGLLGNILTGIFAQKSIALANGQIIEGGWIDKHFVQMGWQLANSVAGSVYSFVVTVRPLPPFPIIFRDISCYIFVLTNVGFTSPDRYSLDNALHPWTHTPLYITRRRRSRYRRTRHERIRI